MRELYPQIELIHISAAYTSGSMPASSAWPWTHHPLGVFSG
ncbi:MAG TPA: hypothetical protein VJS42_01675 [Steroidobacteraceae bacterium]|nr:hypothetical protein [Steroidobacteraceae bacterium]